MEAKNLAEWSKMVKEADGCKCVLCGSGESTDRLHRLESHHVEMRKKHPEKALQVENGVTLCHVCHRKIHGYNYMRMSYPDDFMQADFSPPVNGYRWSCDKEMYEMRARLQHYLRDRYILELYIETELLKKVQDEAKITGESVTGLINRLLDEYIKRMKPG